MLRKRSVVHCIGGWGWWGVWDDSENTESFRNLQILLELTCESFLQHCNMDTSGSKRTIHRDHVCIKVTLLSRLFCNNISAKQIAP